MSTLGERVKAERESRGWSQVELARRVSLAGYSMTQGGIAQIERRGDTEPKSIVQLAQALGVSITWLQSNRGDKMRKAVVEEIPAAQLPLIPMRGRGAAAEAARAERALAGIRPPLQVFSSAQGGSEGAMILSNEPVAWIPRDTRLDGIAEAYGCFVSGDSMEPAYERGNLLLINPTAAVNPGEDCVFLREGNDGTRYALVKRLVRRNANSWTVKQFNPDRTFSLPHKDWPKAHLVIGKYNRWT